MRIVQIICLAALTTGLAIPWVVSKTLIDPSFVSARFDSIAEIDEAVWQRQFATATCVLISSHDKPIDVLGVQTPCGCIGTDELPTSIQPREVRRIVFEIDLHGFPATKAGKTMSYPMTFFTTSAGNEVKATLDLLATIDLVPLSK